MLASRPSASIALRTFWLTVLSSCGVSSGSYRTQVRPSRSVGSFAPFACRMNVRRIPSAPPNSPASKTTLSRGEAWPGIGVPGSPGVGAVQSSWANTNAAKSTSRVSSTSRSSVLTPGLKTVVQGSTSATVARPPVRDFSSLPCLPDDPRKMRGFFMMPRILGPSEWPPWRPTALRTSASSDLPDFPWPASYAEVQDGDGGTLRTAYVDAGPADGPVALLLHGEPSWSFLYRHVIPVLTDAGIRCVAPDMVGFGRSDKPLALADHTFARHVEWMRELVLDHLDLHEVTMFGQDWGGLLGLRLVAEHPDRFARVVAANTGLPTGDFDMPEIWWMFRNAVEKAEVLDIGRLVAAGCVRGMTDEVRAAYDAPFPTEESKVGVRVMPTLVPTRPDDPAAPANRLAWAALGEWDRPFLTAFSDSDPITGGMDAILQRARPRRARPRPPHHHERRPLPPGGRRPRARPRRRHLHPRAGGGIVRDVCACGTAGSTTQTSRTIPPAERHSPMAVVAAARTGAVTSRQRAAPAAKTSVTCTGSAVRSAYRFWIGSRVATTASVTARLSAP